MIATFAGHGSCTIPVNHRKQRTSDDERKSLLRAFISTRFVLPSRYPRFASKPLYIHSAEQSAGCFNWIHSVVIPGVHESRSSPEPYSDYCIAMYYHFPLPSLHSGRCRLLYYGLLFWSRPSSCLLFGGSLMTVLGSIATRLLPQYFFFIKTK